VAILPFSEPADFSDHNDGSNCNSAKPSSNHNFSASIWKTIASPADSSFGFGNWQPSATKRANASLAPVTYKNTASVQLIAKQSDFASTNSKRNRTPAAAGIS
jgi:hypothetical protein